MQKESDIKKNLYIPVIINEREEILPKYLHQNINEILISGILFWIWAKNCLNE